ncbi:MAG: flagellar hook-associated protein FlgK [Planctomycetota bacterium]|nr:flagellar hook-associated protein FlgK [Planctomycetota bacterium]
MSLFGTIQQSAGALQLAQVGLQVVGNNIANANTPGYVRQQLQQAAAVAIRDGNLIRGMGVRPIGITQAVDKALTERMYAAKTDLVGAETLDKAFSQLEELTTDLDNTGLSQQLSLFNNALHELASQPGDASLREYVILQGETLAANIRRQRADTSALRDLWDVDVDGISDQINRLTTRIARANLDIATIEGGGLTRTDATGLRDQRYRDLEELAELINVNIQEQESGAVAVFVGGDYIISNGTSRDVYAAQNKSLNGTEVRIVETDAPLQVASGKLASSMLARDEVFGNYVDNLDKVASALIHAVNEVHSQGQGRKGFTELTSSNAGVTGVPLPNAELPFVPRNGTFDMNVVDDQGRVISNHRISVDLLGQVTDSTIQSIVAEMNAIDGLNATTTSSGYVAITTDSPNISFTFGEDTSGFLAAMGINNFFTGNNAIDIEVSPNLVENSDYLAISSGGINQDTNVLMELVDIVDKPLAVLNDRSARQTYTDSISMLGQKISLQQSATEGLRSFHATLEGRHLAITGVNIDEEAIDMITYQRAFQASSRVIAAASEMLELLVNL